MKIRYDNNNYYSLNHPATVLLPAAGLTSLPQGRADYACGLVAHWYVFLTLQLDLVIFQCNPLFDLGEVLSEVPRFCYLSVDYLVQNLWLDLL